MKWTTLIALLGVALLVGCGMPGDPIFDNLYTQNVYPGTASQYTVGSDDLPYLSGYFDYLYLNGIPLSSGNAASGDATSGNATGNTTLHSLGGDLHDPDTLANLNTKVTDATLDDSSAPRTPSAHTIASHSDTTATGAELDELTGGGATILHSHAGAEEASIGGAYTELAGTATTTAAGQGGGDGVWVDWDLSAIIGAGSTVVEICIEKFIATDAVGVKKNGSDLARSVRLLKLQTIVLNCECDANRVIKIMSDDVSDADVFSVMGYWN